LGEGDEARVVLVGAQERSSSYGDQGVA